MSAEAQLAPNVESVPLGALEGSQAESEPDPSVS